MNISKKLKLNDVKIICQQFYRLLNAGCLLVTSIDIIIDSSSRSVRRALLSVKQSLEKGCSLYQSFKNTGVFPAFFVQIIYAAGESGNIDSAFHYLYRYYDREKKIKNKIISASIYPCILLSVFLVSINFILIVVVPRFESIISNTDTDNQMYFIFNISRFLKENLIYIILLFMLTILTLSYYLKKSDWLSYKFDYIKLKSPVLNRFFRLILIDRFTQSMCILMKSGNDIGRSLDISGATVGNLYFSELLDIAAESIEQGNSFSKSISMTGFFPAMFISLLKTGEESGKFIESLEAINEYYKEEFDLRIEKFITLIEPVMILVMGVFIGLTLICIISPMMNMLNGIK